MALKHKFSYDAKIKIETEYLEDLNGFRESCRIYKMSQSASKDWIRLYNTFGASGLKAGNKCTKYSLDMKKNALNDYFSKKLSVPEILIKYKVRSTTQLKRWIMKYNSHEQLKTSGTGETIIMTKGRKTTYDERIEIVQYCIEHKKIFLKLPKNIRCLISSFTW